MNTDRNNFVNKQSIYLLAIALIIFLSNSCMGQKTQNASEQNKQNLEAQTRQNRIGCKSPEEIENIKPPVEWKGSDLQRAVFQRDIKTVKKLLQQNVDIEEKDNYGRTA